MFTSVSRIPPSLKTQVEKGQTSFKGPITSVDQALEALSADLQDPRHNYYKRVQQAGELPLRPLSEEEKSFMMQALEREKKRNGLALTMRSVLNEAEPLNDTVLGKMAAGLGSSLPLVLAATPQGMLAAGAGYANADFHEIMAQHPEMDEAAAAKVALVSGVVKAGLDKLSLFGLGKLAPNVVKVLTGQATSQMVKRKALQAGATYGFENLQEGLQDLTRPAVQSLAASLDQDIPGVDWDREMKQFWGSRLDVALGVLPLTLLGIGHNTLRNRQSVLEILNNDQTLKLAGLAEDDRASILKAAKDGDDAKAQSLLQEAWSRRDPAVAAEAIKETDEAQAAATQRQPTENKNPYRKPDGTLLIPERASSSSDPALAQQEKKLLDIANNQPRADKLYNEIPDAKGGKVIGTDIARELLPEFAESREGKINYTNATGRVAQAYAKDRLWREIENPQGRTKLMFTAGGVAAGKSTAVTDEMVAASDLVFDGTLRETDWAIKTIEHAIAKGWRVEINYVQRPLPLVLQGAIDRAQSKGRWGSLADLPAIHQAAQQSIIKIAKHFEGHPNFALKIWLNDGKTLEDPPKKLTLKQIDAGGEYSYHENETNESRLDRTGTQGTGRNLPAEFREEGAQTARRIFEEAVRSRKYEPRVLRLLAQGNPELEALVPPDH